MMSKSLFRQALYVYLLNLQVDVGEIVEKKPLQFSAEFAQTGLGRKGRE